MNQGVEMLDEALNLARQEKSALEGGQYEDAIGMAQKRSEITGMAWNYYDRSEKEHFRKRLLELSGLQMQLTEIATKAQMAVRRRMNAAKLERRRLNGYHLAVSQALQ